MNNKKILIIVAVLVILLGVFCIYKRTHDLPSGLSGRWQAVFLDDGQVYFGRLSASNAHYAVLREVYYLKVTGALQQGEGNAGGISDKSLNLIKLGGEAHGPENEMYIAKTKILFIENLKNDSNVLKAISAARK